jgi:hypothetical protein
MRDPKSVREESERRRLKECKGCSEVNAFKDWEWAFNPAKDAPANGKLNEGDLVLVISRNPRDSLYYCAGLGVVKEYKKWREGNNFCNKLKCDPDTSVAFTFPAGLIEYPYGKRGYPKTGQACHTEKIGEEKVIELLEEAKKKHEEIKEKEIAQKIETAINIIKEGRKMGKGEISENKTEQIGRILNAINTKPFIILSGISGTGKTQIARIISAGMVKEDSPTESGENKSREGK